jgi:hypothetical protein
MYFLYGRKKQEEMVDRDPKSGIDDTRKQWLCTHVNLSVQPPFQTALAIMKHAPFCRYLVPFDMKSKSTATCFAASLDMLCSILLASSS